MFQLIENDRGKNSPNEMDTYPFQMHINVIDA